MHHTFKVLFYIKRSAPLKSGLVPIFGRIAVNGRRTQFSTRLALPPEAWDVAQNRAMGRAPEMAHINQSLDAIRLELERCYAELLQRRMHVTPELVKDHYLRGGYGRTGLLQLVANHNREFSQQVGVDRSPSTLQKYNCVQRHLAQFIPTYTEDTDLPLEAISKLLGHQSIRTTQIYATITRSHLDREMSRLSQQLEPLAARWRQ